MQKTLVVVKHKFNIIKIKMAKKRKNLAKNKPVVPPNMTFEEKVELKSKGKLKAKTIEKKRSVNS